MYLFIFLLQGQNNPKIELENIQTQLCNLIRIKNDSKDIENILESIEKMIKTCDETFLIIVREGVEANFKGQELSTDIVLLSYHLNDLSPKLILLQNGFKKIKEIKKDQQNFDFSEMVNLYEIVRMQFTQLEKEKEILDLKNTKNIIDLNEINWSEIAQKMKRK